MTRYGYTGRERDADTGLLYYRARFYDPQLGRFISEDPIGFAGGDINLYGYVWHNPLNHTDPSGLDGGPAPSDVADRADEWIEIVRSELTGLNPHAVNRNTVINYAANTYRGVTNLLRVGRGFGNYYFNNPCTIGADELFADIGRASGIALLLAGPATGLVPNVRATPGPVAAKGAATLPEGSFSIVNWSGYPANLPKPTGPFRLLEGAEYNAARAEANAANRAMHQADPVQIHEIQPVKFGGSPTNPLNKIPLTPQQHSPATTWWNQLQRSIEP